MDGEARRRSQRQYAIRRRDAQRPRGMTRCHLDGYPLTMETDGIGRLVVACPACVRRRAHRCMDCGAPVKGRAWRCAPHKKATRDKAWRKYQANNRKMLCRKAQARYQADPAERRRRNEYKKRWRAENPWKVLAHRRTQRLSRRGGFKTRDAYLAYHKAYNAARAAEKREYMKRFNKNPEPCCGVCGRPIPYQGKGAPPKRCPAHNPWRRQAAAA